MALVLLDRVQQTGTANTTVSFTLSGSVTGFQGFSVVGNGSTTYYAAYDTVGNWETGLGTYTTAGTLLTRNTIYASSNAGSAVTFSGTVNIFVTYPASTAVYGNGTTLVAPASAILPAANGGTGASTLTGVIKGNGTSAFTAATSGTDYSAGTSALGTGILKSTTSTGALTIAVAADFPTLNQNTTGSAGSVTNALTINNGGTGAASGSTYNGSAALTISYNTVGAQVAGTYVTSVGATSPVTSSGGTTPTIAMPAATTSVNGYLTSTDWNTFNGKQAAGTYLTSVTGTAPVVSSGGTTPAISMAAATTSVNGYLTSTDWTTFNGKQAALVSGTNIKTVNSTTLLGSGDVSVGVTSVTGTAPVVSSGGATPAISMAAATTSVSGYLTSTDWNTFNNKGSGTVTGVTGTAPVVSSGGTAPAISMAAATTSVNGYLTSTDWTTFNNKSPAAGSSSIVTVGTITSGTWNGSSIATTYTAAKVTDVQAGTGVSVSATTGSVSVSIGQAVATSSNVQFNSFGVGTAGSATTGEIRATNNITAFYSSDRTLKENIQDIPNALGIVSSIGSKTFDWTDAYLEAHGGVDGYFVQKSDFGVIAQDVQKVFPIAVRTREDGTLAVDYEKLGTLAFAAIGQLLKRVEALEAK